MRTQLGSLSLFCVCGYILLSAIRRSADIRLLRRSEGRCPAVRSRTIEDFQSITRSLFSLSSLLTLYPQPRSTLAFPMMLSGCLQRPHDYAEALCCHHFRPSFDRTAARSGARVSFRSENSCPVLATAPGLWLSSRPCSGLGFLTDVLTRFPHDLILRQTTSVSSGLSRSLTLVLVTFRPPRSLTPFLLPVW